MQGAKQHLLPFSTAASWWIQVNTLVHFQGSTALLYLFSEVHSQLNLFVMSSLLSLSRKVLLTFTPLACSEWRVIDNVSPDSRCAAKQVSGKPRKFREENSLFCLQISVLTLSRSIVFFYSLLLSCHRLLRGNCQSTFDGGWRLEYLLPG